MSLRLQKKLANLSSRGKQQTVPNASHMIPTDEPMAIVNVVREMVEAARR